MQNQISCEVAYAYRVFKLNRSRKLLYSQNKFKAEDLFEGDK